MLIVDTHAHIYHEDEARYPICDAPYRPPAGAGTLAHMNAERAANGVDRVVWVHTFTMYRWDNSLVADTVLQTRAWATGVCALNPDDPGSPALLERLCRDFGMRGLRVFPVATQDGGRSFERPGHWRLWEKCGELGMVVCALIHAQEIPTLRRYLERFPSQAVVLDHCANLAAADHDGPNLQAVLDLAAYPNLYAKVTNVVTGSAEPWPCRDMHTMTRRIIETYGPNRCIWGSDFPCELWIPKTDLAGHIRLFTSELGLEPSALAAVMGSTALRLWFPEDSSAA
jgi:predicted TIM-barrel fold metal-dependent hydrolase